MPDWRESWYVIDVKEKKKWNARNYWRLRYLHSFLLKLNNATQNWMRSLWMLRLIGTILIDCKSYQFRLYVNGSASLFWYYVHSYLQRRYSAQRGFTYIFVHLCYDAAESVPTKLNGPVKYVYSCNRSSAYTEKPWKEKKIPNTENNVRWIINVVKVAYSIAVNTE